MKKWSNQLAGHSVVVAARAVGHLVQLRGLRLVAGDAGFGFHQLGALHPLAAAVFPLAGLYPSEEAGDGNDTELGIRRLELVNVGRFLTHVFLLFWPFFGRFFKEHHIIAHFDGFVNSLKWLYLSQNKKGQTGLFCHSDHRRNLCPILLTEISHIRSK